MAGITTTNAHNELSALLRAVTFTGPATLYMSLHTGDPGDTGANEYTAYTGTRPQITFSAPANKQTASTAQIDYTGMGSTSATPITHVGFWSATSGGTFQDSVPLVTARSTASGDTLRFPAGSVTRSVSG